MRHAWLLLVAALVFMFGSYVGATEVGVSAKVGTLGVGGDLSVGLSSSVNARLAVNWFGFEYDDFDLSDDDEDEAGDEEDEDEADIDKLTASLDLLTIGLLCDWHPWGSGIRLTAGAFLNNNKLSLSAVPGDTISLNDADYEVQSLDGEVSFDKFSPYVGIGWGNAVDLAGRWSFSFDLGLMYHGEPSVDLSATALDPTLQDTLNADLDVEQAELEEDVKAFVVYPVLAMGVSYRF